MAKSNENFHMPTLFDTKLNDGMLYRRQIVNRNVTFAAIEKNSLRSGHTAYMRGNMRFDVTPAASPAWGNDVFKWIEGLSYSLAQFPDQALEEKIDKMIALIEAEQCEDGYWNPFFTHLMPNERWINLTTSHELFVAGHMITAAVRYYQTTKKERFLKVACKFADHIYHTFGDDGEKIAGYDGHQGIKMGLMDLYELTKEPRYLELVKFFIEVRGTEPNFFQLADARRTVPLKAKEWKRFFTSGDYAGMQAHKPIREQADAEGHAVRYLFQMIGVLDYVLETGDEELWELVQQSWNDITKTKMYLTGGIGSTTKCEAFTYAYDLNNELAYNETCGSVYMFFWGYKMLQKELNAQYADVMEKQLYNGALSGVSLTGDEFMYCNPLAIYPKDYEYAYNRRPSESSTRRPWFPVACCPPNLAKMLAALSRYVYSYNDEMVAVHLYTASEITLKTRTGNLKLIQTTKYPYDETVCIRVETAEVYHGEIALRIPGWCKEWKIEKNGVLAAYRLRNGYAILEGEVCNQDEICLVFKMPIRFVVSRPEIRWNSGKMAIMRGPIVYCLEEEENGKELQSIAISDQSTWRAVYEPDVLGGTCVIYGTGKRFVFADDEAYKEYSDVVSMEIPLTAVPYCLWNNRSNGEMTVWLAQDQSK